ncbi:MAG: N-acetyltransferase [Pirellulales bacterium]|nr:N-acetyltransferase [Pirellulales bacterium]
MNESKCLPLERLQIREVQPDDADALAAVHTRAFGRGDEARLVAAITASEAFVPGLSLGAWFDGGPLVGHILLSQIRVGSRPALSLAPLAVWPEYQRRGVGKALCKHALRRAAELGHRAVVVLGHPAYYAAQGFVAARPLGIEPPFPVHDDEAWRALELAPGAFAELRGTVEYPPPWSVVL